jgi:hypothetical protein
VSTQGQGWTTNPTWTKGPPTLTVVQNFPTTTTFTGPVWPQDPDSLHLGRIGPAHTLRGRVVRALFWLLKIWPAR